MLSVSRFLGSSDIQGRPANPQHRAGRARQSPSQARDRRGQGPHSTDTALPAPGPANASSAAGIVFAVCSCTVAMLSWGRGDGHTGPVGVRGTRFHWEGLKTKSEKCRKQKGAWAITGLGHGLINWCGDVRFTPKSGHSHGSRKRSACDPKRTFGVPKFQCPVTCLPTSCAVSTLPATRSWSTATACDAVRKRPSG